MESSRNECVVESIFSSKSKFQSKYPEKYKYLDYSTKLSENDMSEIKRIFSINIPKYIEDMKNKGMKDKYNGVVSRYIVNSVHKKYQDEIDSHKKQSSSGGLRSKVQSIGSRVYKDTKKSISGNVYDISS